MADPVYPPPPGSETMAGPTMAQQAHIQAQQHALHAAEMAKRAKIRAKRPTDRNMPDGVEDIVIGDGVQTYRDLTDFERRLDATMMKKRLDIIEAVNRNVKVGSPSRNVRGPF